ncbi:SGNH/GDSL hydrolase family protein [Candidatus Electronema sp. PJ]|uniref:SGNH/GDSL hydrolase family protein n=1 Tax=Candidatus Electronema sp. PJ TaxID=3401572 RepID=UPI003AA7E794
MRFLVTPRFIPPPPLPRTIDPYQFNPYIVQTKPYFYFHIPKAAYIQARSAYRVQYVINSRGFRGPEIILPKPVTVKRLLVVGDSIVEGHGSEFSNTFTHLLGAHLGRADWEVVNAGVQGASPVYYAANAERYAALEPDAVLLMLYENDLWEDRERELAYFHFPSLDDADRILYPTAESRRPLSYFYAGLTRLRRNLLRSPLEQLIADHQKALKQTNEFQAAVGKGPFALPSALVDRYWQMSQEYLNYFATYLQQRKVKLLITHLSVHSVQPKSGLSALNYANSVDHHASRWAKEKKLPFFSLLPMMHQAFKEKKVAELIIKGDGHPTSNTHARIEAALRPWLQQHLD